MTALKRLYLLCVMSCAICASADAQCAAGDIMWVSETVNADVGLGAGAGRCGTNTVAGAACNSSGSPFGIQAAIDCYVNGVTIRILAGSDNYDSNSNSWNNRFDATKTIICNNCNSGGLIPTRIEGWVDTGTPCTSLQQADCPVTLDFDTGTGDGFACVGGGGPCARWHWEGLRITNAAGDGLDVGSGGGPFSVTHMQFDNNGVKGLEGNAKTYGFSYDVLAFDNGDSGWEDSAVSYGAFIETYDNTNEGLEMAGFMTQVERAISYNDDGTQDAPLGVAGPELNIVLFSTLLGATTNSGWNQSTGQAFGAGSFGVIYQRNTRYGMENYSPAGTGRMSQWTYNLTCLNGSGTYNPASPYFAGIRNGNRDDLDEAFFPSGGPGSVGGNNNLSGATGFAAIDYEWPSGVTDDSFCIGATSASCAKISFCGGSLGGYVQGARRIRSGFSLR